MKGNLSTEPNASASLVTWNSHHLQAMDYIIYIKIFSFQLINAFCLMCHIKNHIKSIYGPYMGHPHSPNWTLDFEPAFSQRFYFPLSPRSIFHTRQRFPILKHVTSGCMSPRSIFPTAQRFPIQNHVTSGSHEPAILFSYWSAVSPTGNDL